MIANLPYSVLVSGGACLLRHHFAFRVKHSFATHRHRVDVRCLRNGVPRPSRRPEDTVALAQQITSRFPSFAPHHVAINPVPDSIPLDVYGDRSTESVLSCSCHSTSTPPAARYGTSDGRGGARRSPARHDGGRHPGRAGGAGERPRGHRARPIRRRRAQRQDRKINFHTTDPKNSPFSVLPCFSSSEIKQLSVPCVLFVRTRCWSSRGW